MVAQVLAKDEERRDKDRGIARQTQVYMVKVIETTNKAERTYWQRTKKRLFPLWKEPCALDKIQGRNYASALGSTETTLRSR